MKRRARPSPLQLGTVTYGDLEARIAFTAALAPYFAKIETVPEKQQPQAGKRKGK